MNEDNEPHNMFIASLSGKLDICSDILSTSVSSILSVFTDSSPVLTIASILYNSSSSRPAPKSTLGGPALLCFAKMVMGWLRVSITNGYMGYGYTWSLYWQTAEAYTLIYLESILVIRPIFVPVEKIAASEFIALSLA
jgi:hypothetical protein